MEKVKLYASKNLDGTPSGFVVELTILPFANPPDVIVWGARAFQLYDKRAPLVYVECFMHVVPQLNLIAKG